MVEPKARDSVCDLDGLGVSRSFVEPVVVWTEAPTEILRKDYQQPCLGWKLCRYGL